MIYWKSFDGVHSIVSKDVLIFYISTFSTFSIDIDIHVVLGSYLYDFCCEISIVSDQLHNIVTTKLSLLDHSRFFYISFLHLYFLYFCQRGALGGSLKTREHFPESLHDFFSFVLLGPQ